MSLISSVSVNNRIAFVCMVCGMFMAVLDIQIVASSLKEIQAGLLVTQDEINWVQSSYLIAEVVVIPLTGWLCRIFSTRIVFAVACFGFTVMSIGCALSWNLNSMIVFRALQGLLGGAMIPAVFSVIFVVFPLQIRPTITSVVGLIVTIAPIAGPVLGGYITNYLSWHYLFLLNIIPGILVTLGVLKFVNFDKPNYNLLKNIDIAGIVLIAVSLGSLQYVLEEGLKEQWLESNLICSLAVISLVSGMYLVYQELTHPSPVVNLRAFGNRNFTCGCIFNFILGWGMFSAVFMMPVFLDSIKGFNSLQVGQYLFVTGLFQLISAPVAGMLSKKMDLRLMLSFGVVMFGISCLLNMNITSRSGFMDFFMPQAVRGFSLMFCFLPITSLTFATLPAAEVPTASGLYNLMRNLGGAIGLAVTNTCLQNWTKKNYLPLMEKIDASRDLSNDTITILEQNFTSYDYGAPYDAALRNFYGILQREAYVLTFNQIFTHIAIMFFASVIIVMVVEKVNISSAPNTDVH